MPVLTQGDNSCYFVHIPRTAGRYVGKLFEQSDGVETDITSNFLHTIAGIHSPHVHYPLYYEICNDNIPHITIVRNPVDKFTSAVKIMANVQEKNFDPLMRDEYDFYKFVYNEILAGSKHNNWFLPQYKFISPRTRIWKYEWGFGANFQRWVKKNTGIEIDITPVEYVKFDEEEKEVVKDFTPSKQTIRNIKKFYRKDYRTFNYWKY
jgi:hypothetical protein